MELMTFECASDYVTKVRWNPTNPLIFAMADLSGRVFIINITKKSHALQWSIRLSENGLYTLQWKKGGKILLAGDSKGRTFVLHPPEELTSFTEHDLLRFDDKFGNDLA